MEDPMPGKLQDRKHGSRFSSPTGSREMKDSEESAMGFGKSMNTLNRFATGFLQGMIHAVQVSAIVF
jgi:hypothetical protein